MPSLGDSFLRYGTFSLDMNKVTLWWGRCVYVSLCISIVLLGIGGDNFLGVGVKAWTFSRTTFFFWLVWKLQVWYVHGHERIELEVRSIPKPLILFFAIVTVSLLPDFRQARDYRDFFFACMHGLMVYDLFSTRERSRLLFYLLGVVPGVIVVRGLLNDMSILDLEQMKRLSYPLGHPNTAGYMLSISIPLCLSVIAVAKKLRILALLSCGAQLLGILLTYSRGAWIGLSVAVLSWCLMANKWKMLLAILTVSSAVALVATPVQERLLSLVKPGQDPAINERMKIMETVLKLGFENPILGVGYGSARLREGLGKSPDPRAKEQSSIAHSHNVYVELFACTGLLGLGSFLWLLWDATSRLFLKILGEQNRNDRLMEVGMLAAFVAFMTTGLADVPFYFYGGMFYFALLSLIYLYLNDVQRLYATGGD